MKIYQIDRHDLVIIVVSAIISCLLISCSDKKYSQCEQIINIANRVADQTKQLTQTKNTDNVEIKAWLQAAELMSQAAGELEKLSIQDPQLIKYLSDLVKVYRTNSQATYEIVKARESQNLAAAKTAQAEVQTAGEWEQKLGTGINNYCQTQ